ncbi:MAG: ankyrin repeat domain-containing protein [Micavibrio sp.]|nr:MAG: ankyrin repeat domain-containing protein [Micavibrio sp.]
MAEKKQKTAEDAAKKPKKPKKTKEERAAARKAFFAHLKWRTSLVFKGLKGMRKELAKQVAAEDHRKINSLLNNFNFDRAVGEHLGKPIIILGWEEAIAQKKEGLYELLLNHPADPGLREKKAGYSYTKDIQPGQYVMAYAVALKEKDLLQAVLKAGVDPNFAWREFDWKTRGLRGTPLSNAIARHDVEFTEILLQHGAKAGYGDVAVLVKNLSEKRGVKTGHQCLDLILAQKPPIDGENGELLRVAASGRDAKTFEKLLQAGADLELSWRYTHDRDIAAFMQPYVEKSRTGWHLAGEDVVIKVSYAADTDTRVREIFNFGSEIVTTQINDDIPAQMPFNQVAQKQIQKAKEQCNTLQGKSRPNKTATAVPAQKRNKK